MAKPIIPFPSIPEFDGALNNTWNMVQKTFERINKDIYRDTDYYVTNITLAKNLRKVIELLIEDKDITHPAALVSKTDVVINNLSMYMGPIMQQGLLAYADTMAATSRRHSISEGAHKDKIRSAIRYCTWLSSTKLYKNNKIAPVTLEIWNKSIYEGDLLNLCRALSRGPEPLESTVATYAVDVKQFDDSLSQIRDEDGKRMDYRGSGEYDLLNTSKGKLTASTTYVHSGKIRVFKEDALSDIFTTILGKSRPYVRLFLATMLQTGMRAIHVYALRCDDFKNAALYTAKEDIFNSPEKPQVFYTIDIDRAVSREKRGEKQVKRTLKSGKVVEDVIHYGKVSRGDTKNVPDFILISASLRTEILNWCKTLKKYRNKGVFAGIPGGKVTPSAWEGVKEDIFVKWDDKEYVYPFAWVNIEGIRADFANSAKKSMPRLKDKSVQYTPHVFRHTCGSVLMAIMNNTPIVSERVGWDSSAVEGYLHGMSVTEAFRIAKTYGIFIPKEAVTLSRFAEAGFLGVVSPAGTVEVGIKGGSKATIPRPLAEYIDEVRSEIRSISTEMKNFLEKSPKN